MDAILVILASISSAVVDLLSAFDWSSFLGWFIPASVALGLYVKRKKDQKNRLRVALRSEIQEHGQLVMTETHVQAAIQQHGVASSGGAIRAGIVPPADYLSTVVYESQAGELGSLDAELVDSLVEYYSELRYAKSLLQTMHEGTWLPPAAYGMAPWFIGELIDHREELLRALGQGEESEDSAE